jgi:predicted phosphodiesterase
MRFAIVSDLHANLQAWNAVLLDIRSQKLDRIICLGDVVGYGPNPAEVLRSVHQNVNHLVLGNHDAVVCGKMDSSLFNATARTIIEWTRGQLNREAFRFLSAQPLTLEAGIFRCAHGDFSEPAAFQYVLDPADALPSWQAVEQQVLFVGHSHVPGIFVLGQSGVPHRVEAQDFEVEDGKRYLVNVGSVGQPRDGEARSCYCVFDPAAGDVWWRRIPFDLDAYRESLLHTGLPEQASYFLRHDPRHAAPPIRELLNFSPPTAPEQTARDVVEVQKLKDLQQSVRRWKWLSWCFLATGVLLAALIAALWLFHATRHGHMDGAPDGIVTIAPDTKGNLLTFPKGQIAPGERIPGWNVQLGDRRQQSAAVQQDGGRTFILLSSRTARDELTISSPWFAAENGERFSCEVLARYPEGFRGQCVVVISLRRKTADGDKETDLYYTKEPNERRADGWLMARNTFDKLPSDTTAIRLSVRGRFIGRIELTGMELTRKKR